MRDQTPKMLDFLGLASQAQSKARPASFSDVLGLINVAATGEEVK
jgi:hypothetical protein